MNEFVECHNVKGWYLLWHHFQRGNHLLQMNPLNEKISKQNTLNSAASASMPNSHFLLFIQINC